MKAVTVAIVYDASTNTYGATSDELPDIVAISEDRDDVLRRFVGAAHAHLEFLRETGEPLPIGFASDAEFVAVPLEV